MITRALLATIFVGLFTGLIMTAVQQWRVVPLIIAAEAFEGETPVTHDHAAVKSGLSLATPAYAHSASEELGPLGLSRLGGTVLANLVTYSGFALLLFGLSTLLGRQITLATAVAWGACGWLALHFLPAVGLPPELPGFPAAEVEARKIWWVATVIMSGAGLGLLALKDGVAFKLGGLALIVLPHVFGAPQPTEIATAVPALYAAEYSVAALTASLISWLVLAFGLGMANERLAKAGA
jgi:cobalt transporter subunit CbtA